MGRLVMGRFESGTFSDGTFCMCIDCTDGKLQLCEMCKVKKYTGIYLVKKNTGNGRTGSKCQLDYKLSKTRYIYI
jgi:hypothetical protein